MSPNHVKFCQCFFLFVGFFCKCKFKGKSKFQNIETSDLWTASSSDLSYEGCLNKILYYLLGKTYMFRDL